MKVFGALLALLVVAIYGGYALADDDDTKTSGAKVTVQPDVPDADDAGKKQHKHRHRYKIKDDDDKADVNAPFVKVSRDEDGNVHVRAPFTHVDADEKGHARVRAPFTKVDQ